MHCPTFSLLKIRFVPIFVTFLCNFFLTNLVILAIFAKFLSNVPLSGQKSHFFKDFVPLSGFDRLAGMLSGFFVCGLLGVAVQIGDADHEL